MTHLESLRLRDEFAHYKRSYALLHEDAFNRLIEYRRLFTPDRGAIFLEARVLQPNGQPYHDAPDDGPWYLVSDEEWRYMIYNASEILSELCDLRQ